MKVPLLQLGIFRLKCPIRFLQFRIICRERGYLSANKSNLAAKFRLWRAAINHPVECINMFFECHNRRWSNIISRPHRAVRLIP